METANSYLAEVDYLTEYDAIVKAVQYYIDGARAGNSDLMRSGFHQDATLIGYDNGNLMFTPVQALYDWINANGPASDIEPNFASIEIIETIAVVHLEVKQWSGNLAGSGVLMSDLFNLIKMEDGWKISQKMFYWHAQQI